MCVGPYISDGGRAEALRYYAWQRELQVLESAPLAPFVSLPDSFYRTSHFSGLAGGSPWVHLKSF